jgi:hypothetical protein
MYWYTVGVLEAFLNAFSVTNEPNPIRAARLNINFLLFIDLNCFIAFEKTAKKVG